MMALLFDLDDTLYPEADYVRSGFRAVAAYLVRKYGGSAEEVEQRLAAILARDGRGRVFDTILKELGQYREDRVALLVGLYRSQQPKIDLYDDVPAVLDKLRAAAMRLGLVTDGLASVQRRKVEALGLARWFETIVCTDELGPGFHKPSQVPFLVALELLDADPAKAAYVGNDPAKDFSGPRALGMLTVRVRRHPHAADSPAGGDADVILDRFENILSMVEA